MPRPDRHEPTTPQRESIQKSTLYTEANSGSVTKIRKRINATNRNVQRLEIRGTDSMGLQERRRGIKILLRRLFGSDSLKVIH